MTTSRFLGVLACLVGVATCDKAVFTEPSGFDNSTDRLDQLTDGAPVTLIGFDASRGGSYSLSDGTQFTAARTSITTVNPNVSFEGIGELTSSALGVADITVLATSRHNTGVVTPLSAAEQSSLLGFVESGGCAVLFVDNHTLAGTPTSDVAHESVLDPFGLDVDGTISGPHDILIDDPAASPVTDGAFGTVSVLAYSWPGGFTDLGPTAAGFGTFSLGFALATIGPGELSPGSGPVVIFSDVTGFADEAYNSAGRFSQNEVTWLNAIDYCLTPTSPDEQLESVKEDVQLIAEQADLEHGESGSLTMKLTVAQKRISRGHDNAAVQSLEAFINQITAMVTSGRLSAEDGQTLVDAAQAVIDGLM